MIGFMRLFLVALVFLSLVYLIVRAYARSVHREELEREWDESRSGLSEADRDIFINAGMRVYQQGAGRRLLWLVFILPAVAFAVIVWLVNAQ